MPQSQSGTPSVGWIKFLAVVTAWLTIILVALIIVLGMFVWRLEVLTDSLVASRRFLQLSSPTAEQSPTPTPTTEPVLKAIPVATPTMTRATFTIVAVAFLSSAAAATSPLQLHQWMGAQYRLSRPRMCLVGQGQR